MSKPKVLIVDDEKNYREIIRQNLEMRGFDVQEAENGLSSIKKCGDQNFDVILMDLKMPDMDGLEATRKIREKDKDVLIIMITGAPSLESSVEAEKYHVYEYLVKPVGVDKLINIIEEGLKEQ